MFHSQQELLADLKIFSLNAPTLQNHTYSTRSYDECPVRPTAQLYQLTRKHFKMPY